MKRFLFVTLVILALGFVPMTAEETDEVDAEQLTGSCGEIKNRNSSYQYGAALWLEYIVETARPMNSFDCPWLTVGVEAWVSGVSGSGASATDLFTASVRRQVPVPSPGVWQTNGAHYRTYLWLFAYSNGSTSSHANVQYRGEDEAQSEAESGTEGGAGGYCPEGEEVGCETSNTNGRDTTSPIIVDVDRNGYHLTSLSDGVRFDLDADGVPELVSWTQASSEDAFLALDRNGNGRVDDGSELFGNHTPAYPTGAGITAANGFEALRFLENPLYGRSERNQIVNAADGFFMRLLLWTDRNHNGISEPDELRSVADAGVHEISTDYKEARRRDGFGNEFRQRAKVSWGNGESFAYDVWLRRGQ